MPALTAEFLNKLKASAETQRHKAEVLMHQSDGAAAMLAVLITHLNKPEEVPADPSTK